MVAAGAVTICYICYDRYHVDGCHQYRSNAIIIFTLSDELFEGKYLDPSGNPLKSHTNMITEHSLINLVHIS